MKGHRLILALLFVASALVVNAARAAEDEGLYFGVKGGLMDPDNGNLDSATNLGAMVGYNLPGITQLGGPVGVEGEITLSAIDGDINGGGDWNVQTMAGYGTYRTGGALYLKGKAGVSYQRVDLGPGDDTDTALSFGLGGGMKIGSGRAELEYTWLKDLNFISVAYIF